MPSPPKTSREIRTAFLEYFRRNGHEVVASSGVVPRGDATLLFANAGMVQFKDAFLGVDKRPYTRAATVQKCIRMSGKHNDLENVGRTARHQTFFEMLGNFSFGDYFKREAIQFAWQFLTVECAIPTDRLVITVFGGESGLAADEDAASIWRDVTGFGDDRIKRLGMADNFWSMGETGPCGPCTEIHYYLGEDAADPSTFGEEPRPDGTGWVEIWNLVFMQFDRAAGGVMSPLPKPCVDTGMGLERLCVVQQGVRSNYDSDLLRPLVELAAQIAGKTYTASSSEDDVSMRVIADHARLTAICLSEGVTPSNEGRGSALRSVMRRAIRHGVKLGITEPFLHRAADKAVDMLGDAYPQLGQRREFIMNEARAEELAFREKIPQGLKLIAEFDGYRIDGGAKIMPGEVAFELYATHGFPVDLTEVIGEEKGFRVDHAGYRAALERHAEISRGGKATISAGTETHYKTARQALGRDVEFTGYDTETGSSTVALVLRAGGQVARASAGDEVEVVVSATPFYGESGGQVGDQGTIRAARGLVRVTDTQKPVPGLVVHVGRVESGTVAPGDAVTLEVDHASRSATRRNHSATHLMHWALRKTLGTHVQQRGSKVGPDVLRFDYSTQRSMTDDEMRTIEDLVNAEVLENTPVSTEVTSQDRARAAGAMMIFEENYGDVVRMLRIGRESIELCGGTHVQRTGDIGLFKIVADAPVGKGIRRITAATGMNALAHLRDVELRTKAVADIFKVAPADVAARASRLLDEQRDLQKHIKQLEGQLLSGAGTVTSAAAGESVREIGGVRAIATKVPVADPARMREHAEKLRDQHAPAVVMLAGVGDGEKVMLVVTVSKDASAKHHAGKIAKEVALVVGGSGGGRADMAQAGGTDPSKIDAAIERFYALLG